ncbi:putative membrane protein [Campylobacter blaseri]|uniref:Uncharacterized protein n=1 Tax=Campylobacter blaseri TaxID=2042961 RepID=A0A2P8QYD0_9BACT|nr:hypothetical protein [Campylobacter blaseri]PSM51258.1 hypothetical protein CQ405_09070 [Campylobacter blaseri]PSM52402.1 hypothetical protein CRN67_09075 [Campylobacter blaseri]QKF86585.1 putative membrane protein [Campylobacter blaseri]
MKKISKNLKKIYWLLVCSPVFLFGAGDNVLKKMATAANEQITEAGSSVASVLNTVILVLGVLWIIFLALVAFFNIEAAKNHAKSILIASIILGICYGLTAAAM